MPVKKILVCEDDIMMQKAITLRLTADGHAVTAVSDGQAAIDILGSF